MLISRGSFANMHYAFSSAGDRLFRRARSVLCSETLICFLVQFLKICVLPIFVRYVAESGLFLISRRLFNFVNLVDLK